MEGEQPSRQLERFEEVLRRLSRVLFGRPGDHTGLSGSQRLVLRHLLQGHLQISEVAATLGVTLSAATGLVDRMARARLVSRERDRADRRVVWVRLTEEGRRVHQETESTRRRVLAEAVSGLSQAEMETLLDLLSKLKS